MGDSYETLGAVCDALGLEPADSLRTPTWNGKPLKEVYPWGTIRKATPEPNLATAAELSSEEQVGNPGLYLAIPRDFRLQIVYSLST